MPPNKKKEPSKEMGSAPSHEVTYAIWKKGHPERRVERRAKFFFDARAAACAELGEDAQSLTGEIVDDTPPKKKTKRTKKKARPSKRRSKR